MALFALLPLPGHWNAAWHSRRAKLRPPLSVVWIALKRRKCFDLPLQFVEAVCARLVVVQSGSAPDLAISADGIGRFIRRRDIGPGVFLDCRPVLLITKHRGSLRTLPALGLGLLYGLLIVANRHQYHGKPLAALGAGRKALERMHLIAVGAIIELHRRAHASASRLPPIQQADFAVVDRVNHCAPSNCCTCFRKVAARHFALATKPCLPCPSRRTDGGDRSTTKAHAGHPASAPHLHRSCSEHAHRPWCRWSRRLRTGDHAPCRASAGPGPAPA